MALIAYDGFDHYGTAIVDLTARRAGGFQWNSQIGMSYVVPGRNNYGMAVAVGQSGYFQGVLSTPIGSGFVGFGARTNLTNFDGNPALYFMDLHGETDASPEVTQVSMRFDVTAGCIEVWRGGSGGTLLARTANNSFTNNTWNHLELFVAISNTAGVVRIRVNGVLVLDLSGQNTQMSPNATFDGLWFYGPVAPTGTSLQIDDFYVSNTASGSGLVPFNDFIGDARVWTLHPTGDSGTQQWTPLAAPNWQQVDDPRNDGDTTYNATSTTGARDNFAFEDLPLTVEVLAVQITGSYRRDDAGTRTIAQHLMSAGSDVAGANYLLPSSYIYCSDFWTIDPATTAAWTVPAVNAAVAGYALVA